MNIYRFLELIEKYLPRQTAMEGDKLGLQIQAGREEIKKLLITMELNEGVVDEAVFNGNDCIITFHPLIFNPLVSITDDNRVGKIIDKLISSRISLISIHTNFDNFKQGTSSILAGMLGMDVAGFLVPDINFPEYGMGVICELQATLDLEQLLLKIQNVCSSPIRYCTGTNKPIRRIAIVAGSGSSFLEDAIKSGADAFITSDVTYHTFHRASGKIALIDPGHYEMEQFVTSGLKKFIMDKIDSHIDIQLSATYTNPVSYFPESGYKTKQINNLSINNGF